MRPDQSTQKKRPALIHFEQRRVCRTCVRPESYCYCSDLSPTETFHRVIILIHPEESRHPIASGRMTHLSLKNSLLIKGLDFSDNQTWQSFIAGREKDTYLVFPDDTSLDLSKNAADHGLDLNSRPLNFIMIDSKWRMAKRMIDSCPVLSNLKRISFTPESRSQFKVRTQPSEVCLSTIEATCELLKVIEPDFTDQKQKALLKPFHRMVERQLEFTPHRHLENKLRGLPREQKESSQ